MTMIRIAREAVPPLLVLLAAALPYGNAFPGELVFDDHGVIEESTLVREARWHEIWSGPNWFGDRPKDNTYRPLSVSSLALSWSLHPSASSLRAGNLALHALASLLVFRLGRRWLGNGAGALWGALFFAVHPIHTEPIDAGVGRADVLAAVLGLLALELVGRSRDAGSARQRTTPWLAAAAVALFGACLAKETALGLVPVLALWIGWPRQGGEWRSVGGRGIFAACVTPLLAAAAYFIVRARALGDLLRLPGSSPHPHVDNPLLYLEGSERLLTTLWTFVRRLQLSTFPWELSPDYSFRAIPTVSGLADPRAAAALLLPSLLWALWLFAAARRWRPALPGAIYLFPDLLVSNLVVPIGTILAERLLYLPSAGSCLVLGSAAGTLLSRAGPRRRPVLAAALGLLILLGGSRTWARNPDWRSDDALFAAAVETVPESVKVLENRAILLLAQGRPHRAEILARRALEIDPYYFPPYATLAEIDRRSGRIREARSRLALALSRMPGLAAPWLSLAELESSLGRREAARAAARRGLARNPSADQERRLRQLANGS